MRSLISLIACVLVFTSLSACIFADEQVDAVAGLIARRLPAGVQQKIQLQRVEDATVADFFVISTSGSSPNTVLHIKGSSGVALATGLNWYLKYFCNIQISWEYNLALGLMSDALPPIPEPVRMETRLAFRYYMNVCTHQYSHGWWNWTKWEENIDWAAMNGVNMPLQLVGQEYVWREFFKSIGVTDLHDYFSGPAFLAWWTMGNIQGWPLLDGFQSSLTESWIEERFALGKQILSRMRQFGMKPVLPAFAGHVPKSFVNVYPKANLSKSSDWCAFPDQYCCVSFLEPVDPLFRKLGSEFLRVQTQLMGTNHLYNGDLFNEMKPRSSDPTYIAETTKAMVSSITDADPQGIWVMQGWLFFNQRDFWQPAQTKAVIEAAPLGKLIILDLYAENTSIWNITESFYGHHFSWDMLLSFGGNSALLGSLPTIATQPALAAKQNPNMISIGITMEAIGNTYIMYDLMLETAWRPDPMSPAQLEAWVTQYATRRYGIADANAIRAWSILASTVYSTSGRVVQSPLQKRPTLVPAEPQLYDVSVLPPALQALLWANETMAYVPTYVYDLVDVKRQVLVDQSWAAQRHVIDAFDGGNGTVLAVQKAISEMMSIISSLDHTLSFDDHFSLGGWLQDAKSWSRSPEEDYLYQFNAKNQLTMWGPDANINDYASKHWSGLVAEYYGGRWSLFGSCLVDVITKAVANTTICDSRLLQFEQQWQGAPFVSHPASTFTSWTDLFAALVGA
eukprot:ANDGO_03742.mRNA.1 Alpha-N-acetylglucosaminidase